jgi:Type III restriction enzyme, res subunit
MPNGSPKLEDRLILFRYFNHLFDADKFEELQKALSGDRLVGSDAQGRSHFFSVLKPRAKIPESVLARYDANLRDDVAAINVHRVEPIQLKYFQYLAALYAEIFLDWRANRRATFLNELNAFVHNENKRMVYGEHFSDFTSSDLNKVAYWMATGSGKTLLLHINYRQFLRYQPNPGDNVLLIIPPGDLLAQQHLDELRLSDVPCISYADDVPMGVTNPVRVIEISKITESKTGGGVSIDVETFEDRNLVFVDEGHKGSGGEAWMNLRDKLAANGFTFEYSATFGQAINTARDSELLEEYSKAILFDYSYRYFHGDGYGKEYQVLNLREDRAEEQRDTLMLANLLAFYEQARLYADRAAQIKPYNIEPPLWIFIGSSVNAVYTEDRQRKSDVLTVILFLRQALQRDWSVKNIKAILDGKAELKDKDGRDLFANRFGYLRDLGMSASQIYDDILRVFFRTRLAGALRLFEIKNADGEIGLKAGNADDYFGLINIGDTTAFFKLAEEEGFAREPDAFSPSLFDVINRPDSRVNVLIGSKKFIEGWSSWRVSTMGLLNIGRAEGTQIIQLFGRGVRLLGKDRSLKRSAFLAGKHPPSLATLETLNIFGVRADYMNQFREFLNREGVPSEGYEEIEVPIRTNTAFLKNDLIVPRLKEGADFTTQYRVLPASFTPTFTLDLRPQVVALDGAGGAMAGGLAIQQAQTISPDVLDLLDWNRLYLDLVEFKQRQDWHNLAIPRETCRAIFERQNRMFTLYAAETDVKPSRYGDLQRVEQTVRAVLEEYTEKFYQRERRRWESQQLEYRVLDENDENLAFKRYTLRVPLNQRDVIEKIAKLLKDMERVYTRENNGLPRVYFDRHLYQPLLALLGDVQVSPPALNEGESSFVAKLRDWLNANPHAVASKDIFLLRNQSRGHGISFFDNAGFLPDFILWIKQGKQQRLVFVDPHGLVLGSGPNDEKILLHKKIKELEPQPANPDVTFDAFIYSTSDRAKLTQMPAWRGFDRPAAFAELHMLFPDDDLAPLFTT